MTCHVFQIEGKYCLVDGESAEIYSLSEKAAKKIIDNDIDIREINEYFKKHSGTAGYIYEAKKRKCHRLTVNITNKCNLACRYCYANCGDYKQDCLPEIETETVKNAVRKAAVLYPEGIEVIQLFGGEPLLAKKNLEDIIGAVRNVCEEERIPVPMFGMVTNGTLIDDETAKFVVKNLASITISLDGKEAVNDFNRKYPGDDGSGVYQRVKQAVKLLKSHDKNFYVKCECTVTARNISDYIQSGKKDNLYHAMYEDIGFDGCLCNPVFGCEDAGISLENIDIDIISEYFDSFICREIYDDEGKLKDIGDLYRIIQVLRKKTTATAQCGANSNDLSVDVAGNMYPCFMFIGEERYKITNVNDDDSSEMRRRYREIMGELEQANSNETCNACWAKRFCSASCGNCIGARYLANGTVKSPVERSCEIGKRILERFLWEAMRYRESK